MIIFRRFRYAPFALALVAITFSQGVDSANVLISRHPNATHIVNGVMIEGRIEQGDLIRVINLLWKQWPEVIDTVGIFSPGGDVLEAMKIGRLIRQLGLSTTIPDDMRIIGKGATCTLWNNDMQNEVNCTCLSACFLIFVAGVNRNGDYVGVHRSFIDHALLQKMRGDEALLYTEMINREVGYYYEDMGVSRAFFDRIKAIPSHEIYILKKGEVWQAIGGQRVAGFEEWQSAKCGPDPWSEMEDEARLLLDKKKTGSLTNEEEKRSAELESLLELYWDCRFASEKDFMATGWRKRFVAFAAQYLTDEELAAVEEDLRMLVLMARESGAAAADRP